MTQQILLNGKSSVSLDLVRRITVIDDQERARIAESGQYGDANRFNLKVHYKASVDHKAARLPILVSDSLADLSTQAAFVNAGLGVHIPAANIVGADNLTDEDRAQYRQRHGRDADARYRSVVRTSAGLVWSAGFADQVMSRKDKALAGFTGGGNGPVGDQADGGPR